LVIVNFDCKLNFYHKNHKQFRKKTYTNFNMTFWNFSVNSIDYLRPLRLLCERCEKFLNPERFLSRFAPSK